MLKLILGRAKTGKTAAIMKEICGRLSEGGVVLLVPEQYSHEAETELLRVCGDRLCLGAEVLSFTRLWARVEAEPGGRVEFGGVAVVTLSRRDSLGFNVIDLGVDVSVSEFVHQVQMHPEVKIVALSTLLTTTMPSMKATVQALRSIENRSFRILVGGAPVTPAFAEKIGADAYSKDAAEAAKTAVQLVEEV